MVEGRARATALLNRAIQSFEEKLAELGDHQLTDPQSSHTLSLVRSVPRSRDVFIVIGHDKTSKTEVARLVERSGINAAVILHEQPNARRTAIEKFEAHGGAAGFAVVLLTPDDLGGAG